jgi:lipoyl(octanoyl) transferase
LISIVQLGTLDYATGLSLQQKLVALRKDEKIGDVLLLLEHKPVITLGRNAKAANVVASPELLKHRGVELFECDRGGDVTFHGPGQIVGYPIFDLRSRASLAQDDSSAQPKRKTMGVIEFVRNLEDVLMRTCADFGIPTKRITGLTGVWTAPEASADYVGIAANRDDDQERKGHGFSGTSKQPDLSEEPDLKGRGFSRAEAHPEKKAPLAAEVRDSEAKLAAIGVHVSRGVTSHGFALNVNTDLGYFNLIIPCGITTKPVTSMQKELGRELNLYEVAESISRNLGVVFQSQILWVETLDALLGNTLGVPMKPPNEFRQLHGEDETTWA